MGIKLVSLGRKVKYPITVTRLLKQPGEQVQLEDSLFEYTYTWMKEVGDPFGETWQETQTTPATWSSPVEGEILSWKINEGDIVDRDSKCVEVDETCSHSVQYGGLCVVCGKDMGEVSWAQESKDSDRAKINMIHDQTMLKVSEGEAQRTEEELQRRLLKNRKLSLVVDLDQTIIHACIEPTVGEWQNDSKSPNYEAVRDVKAFQLADDAPRGVASGIWYYIKMRPGLKEFLSHIAQLYELHVYTMGTRAYAQNIAKIVDPERKLFGDRIISRDENGSMTAKTLQRIFPMDTRMVVIIDDRADVWPKNRPNLIKVVPYDFFVGIGDINSSFLPKIAEVPKKKVTPVLGEGTTQADITTREQSSNDATASSSPTDQVIPSATPTVIPETNGRPTVLQSLIQTAGADDATVLKIQAEEQAEFLEKQLTERPLLQMQQKLEEEDDATEAEANNEESTQNGDVPAEPHQRHHLLKDDDQELTYLESHLTNLHKAFYEEYDRALTDAQGGPVARLRPGQSKKLSLKDEKADLRLVPDVGEVMPRLKVKTLAGTVIVLSGLVPLGADVLSSEIAMQTQSFGAQVKTRVTRSVTHVVVSANRLRTQKVRQAANFPHIKIVEYNWLLDSMSKWHKEDEAAYEISVPRDDNGSPKDLDSSDDSSLGNDNESDEDEEGPSAENADDEESPVNEAISPIDDLKKFDWDSAEAELAEFMASGDEGDESDAESVISRSSEQSTSNEVGNRTAKRMLDDVTTDEEGTDTESHVTKKKRLAAERSTGLKTVSTPGGLSTETDAPTATPQAAAEDGRDVDEVDQIATVDEDDDGNFDADLEAEMMAEFEKEESEEQEGGGA